MKKDITAIIELHGIVCRMLLISGELWGTKGYLEQLIRSMPLGLSEHYNKGGSIDFYVTHLKQYKDFSPVFASGHVSQTSFFASGFCNPFWWTHTNPSMIQG